MASWFGLGHPPPVSPLGMSANGYLGFHGPGLCPPTIGQHVVTWLHEAAGHAGKCSPPSCSGGAPSLCSTFLHHEGVSLGLDQGPHQPGESESSLYGARDWTRWVQGVSALLGSSALWKASKGRCRKVSELARSCVSHLPHLPDTSECRLKYGGGS